MKRRTMPVVYVLRGVLASIANRRIELGVEAVSAGEVLAIVQREAKKREEAEAFARQAGRADLDEQNAAERAILAQYLPAMLDDARLTALLEEWIAEGVSGMGPLMARLKERHQGQYDGKRASEIVRTLLAS